MYKASLMFVISQQIHELPFRQAQPERCAQRPLAPGAALRFRAALAATCQTPTYQLMGSDGLATIPFRRSNGNTTYIHIHIYMNEYMNMEEEREM